MTDGATPEYSIFKACLVCSTPSPTPLRTGHPPKVAFCSVHVIVFMMNDASFLY